MFKLLIHTCIKNHEQVQQPAVRGAYGRLAGVVGIVCNLVLFVLKLTAGILGGSIAILSDAFNNLSDMGASVVSLIGVTAAGRHADEEHPFGHGRFEYVASLIVSFIIMLMGFELLRTSFGRLFSNEMPVIGALQFIILGISVLVKLWMFFCNRFIGRSIDSLVIKAAAQDSLNDVYATLAVILSALLTFFVDFPVDGIVGLLISVIIMLSGFGLARDTITMLLGAPPDPLLAQQICDMILKQEEIQGVHDLILHDYGPGRVMASIHAEVPTDGDIVKIHEVIDATEKQIQQEMGIHIVIHMDPISVSSERIQAVRDFAARCVQSVNKDFSIHDFRMTDGEQSINLIFDLEVPYTLSEAEREEALSSIQQRLKEEDPRFNAVIQVDNKFI